MNILTFVYSTVKFNLLYTNECSQMNSLICRIHLFDARWRLFQIYDFTNTPNKILRIHFLLISRRLTSGFYSLRKFQFIRFWLTKFEKLFTKMGIVGLESFIRNNPNAEIAQSIFIPDEITKWKE